MRDMIANGLGTLGLVALTAALSGEALSAGHGGGLLPAVPAATAPGPQREWRYLEAAAPPHLAGGQRYALAFPPGVGRATMRLHWTRRWRFVLTAPVALKLHAAGGPQPVLHRMPARAPWAVAYEADLRPGAYVLAFGRGDRPTLDFLAEPLTPPQGR